MKKGQTNKNLAEAGLNLGAMEFEIRRATSWGWKEPAREINSMDDLVKLQKEYGDYPLIVDMTDATIIIYDGYLE